MKKIEIREGDIKTVEFLKNEKGGKPICRIEGIIGFISNSIKSFIAPRSVWMVEVSEVHKKNLVVTPFEKIKTPFENLQDIEKAIKALAPVKKERKKKPKIHYKYKSQKERDSENK